MNTAFSELEKQKLEKHYQRYLGAHRFFKAMQLGYLYEFLKNSQVFAPLCAQLKKDSDFHLGNFSYRIVHQLVAFPLHDKLSDRLRLIYLVFEEIGINKTLDTLRMYQIGKKYLNGNSGSEDDQFSVFNMLFVDPLLAWFQTSADAHLVILDQLKDYKYAAEWFHSKKLHDLYKGDTLHGEALLGADLYGHLYDKGIRFELEPKSPAGRLDYIGAQENAKDKILIEAKVFTDKTSKDYLIKGVHQLHHYLKQYNEPAGYLTIYNVSAHTLAINTGANEDGMPFYAVGNTLIYFLLINIFPFDEPASKRGGSKLVEINTTDLHLIQ